MGIKWLLAWLKYRQSHAVLGAHLRVPSLKRGLADMCGVAVDVGITDDCEFAECDTHGVEECEAVKQHPELRRAAASRVHKGKRMGTTSECHEAWRNGAGPGALEYDVELLAYGTAPVHERAHFGSVDAVAGGLVGVWSVRCKVRSSK